MQGDTHYKNFSEEESRIYKENIEMIRSNIRTGVKFDLACEFIAVDDKELKDMIIDDALKVEIAELHYGKRIPLRDVSKKLGLGMERLLKANNEMMEDIVNTAQYTVNKESTEPGSITH